MSKKKKPSAAPEASAGEESVTTRAAVPQEVMDQARAVVPEEVLVEEILPDDIPQDPEMTVNLVGDLPIPGRDDLDAPTVSVEANELAALDSMLSQRKHLRGLLEALIFASDGPIKERELAKIADAPLKQVHELLIELRDEFRSRGINIEEVAGGWVMRTSVQYAPFIRDLTKQKPVKLTRAQVETLAIIAYRQPVTRPEIDDVRGVDSGPVLKTLLERDLIRILGKRDEPGRPMIYGTTQGFLEFFGLKSLKDMPTLREFTELSQESRDVYEAEMGEPHEHRGEPLGTVGNDAQTVEISAIGGEVPMSSFGPDDLEAVPQSAHDPTAVERIEEEISEPISDERDESDEDDRTLTSEAPPPPKDDED